MAVERTWQPLLSAMTSERTKNLVDRDWKNPIITVKTYDNLMTVFQALADYKILSVVVVDVGGAYRGFVDALDMVNFLIDVIDTRPAYTSLSESARQRLLGTTVSELVHRPTKREVHMGYSLFHSLEQMIQGNQKYMALIDMYDRPVGVLTQSMIIRYLNNNLALIGDSIQRIPLWQLRNYTNVISVRDTETAISAFRLMALRSVQGLAVVDMDDKVVDCISVSDLRGLNPQSPNFWKLYESVREFKRDVRIAYPFSVPLSAITVRREETFGDVVRKMASRNVHRVFVVSDTNRLLDIITQTDVLDFAMRNVQM